MFAGSIGLALLCACASYEPPPPNTADANPREPDAHIAECAAQSATLGQCKLRGMDIECNGVPDEDGVFVPLNPGDPVRMVLGPQGARMFVLAVQTTGIHPGDPENPASTDRPNVTISLYRSGNEETALYRGRPAFLPGEENPEALEALGLFVIIDGGVEELIDAELEAVVEIEDVNGELRCGSVMFVATL